jgi:hypothetical protein
VNHKKNSKLFFSTDEKQKKPLGGKIIIKNNIYKIKKYYFNIFFNKKYFIT